MRAKTDIVPLSYRVDDAAQMLGLGKSKMWELVAEGAIPARKIGGATVILHADLEAFVTALPLAEQTKRALAR